MRKSQNKFVAELAQVIVQIDRTDLAEDFLENILTPGEKEEIARRWQIVKQLNVGIPQREIAEKLGVSISTVTRGSRELKYGVPGFRSLLKKTLKNDPEYSGSPAKKIIGPTQV